MQDRKTVKNKTVHTFVAVVCLYVCGRIFCRLSSLYTCMLITAAIDWLVPTVMCQKFWAACVYV